MMNHQQRMEIERRVARKAIRLFKAAGFLLGVNDGEETVLVRSTNEAEILAAMFSTDEDYLLIYDGAGKRCGSLWFIYGNDGWDVINDHSQGAIDPVMAELNAWIDERERKEAA